MNDKTFGAVTRRSLVAAMAAGLALAGAPAMAQDSVTLKTVTPFAPASPLSKPVHILKEVVERETDGRIMINILGGPEVIPSQQQFDGLRNGVIDIMMAAVPYYAGTVPESFALLYTNQNGAEMRESGLFDFMAKVHADRADLHYLANGGGQPSTAFRFYLKEPIDKADFSGLKIRVSATTAAVVEALGGTPVSIPFADTYTALERGVVDGFGATYTGVVEPGLDEVVSYVLQEPFYSLNAPILVNNDVWEGLSQEVKDELNRIGPIYETAVETFNNEALAAEDEALREGGVKFIELPDDEAKKFHEIVRDTGWDAYMEMDPQGGEELRNLATQ